jgi:predicted nucleic acid-binding protein
MTCAISSRISVIAVDTSVAIPAMLAGHDAHAVCLRLVQDHHPPLAGHAAVETFSVLTRLGDGRRLSPARAVSLLEANFAPAIWPDGTLLDSFLRRCADVGAAGGAVFDGLVALAAMSSGARLASLDRRASRLYQAMGIDVVRPGEPA